jgi:hypothetical protein
MVRNSKTLFVGSNIETFYLTPKQGNTTAPENTHKCGSYGIAFGVIVMVVGIAGYLRIRKSKAGSSAI